MKTRSIILLVMFFLGSFLNPVSAKENNADAIQEDFLDVELYTQVNMWEYKKVINAVNYSVENKIPVNTKIKIFKIKGESIKFKCVDNPDVAYELVNVRKYTKIGTEELVKRYFGPKPIDLSVFTEKEQDFIENFEGFFKAGISKEAVLVGRGYPPGHRTESTDLDTWVYWRNKWKYRGLEFEDGLTHSINGTPIE